MVKRRLRFGALSLACLVVLGLVAGAAVAARQFLPAGEASPSIAAVGGPVVPGAISSAAPEEASKPAAAPARLSVPVLGVDADVEPVGVDSLGRMGTPSRPEHVGWYRQGAAPGQPGNAVIDGHLDWTSGPAVFWQLHRLRVGDEAFVSGSDGTRLRFVVDSVSTIAYDANVDGLFVTLGPPSMTLLTCTGAWDRQRATYLQRLVVHLSLPPTTPTEKPGEAG